LSTDLLTTRTSRATSMASLREDKEIDETTAWMRTKISEARAQMTGLDDATFDKLLSCCEKEKCFLSAMLEDQGRALNVIVLEGKRLQDLCKPPNRVSKAKNANTHTPTTASRVAVEEKPQATTPRRPESMSLKGIAALGTGAAAAKQGDEGATKKTATATEKATQHKQVFQDGAGATRRGAIRLWRAFVKLQVSMFDEQGWCRASTYTLLNVSRNVLYHKDKNTGQSLLDSLNSHRRGLRQGRPTFRAMAAAEESNYCCNDRDSCHPPTSSVYMEDQFNAFKRLDSWTKQNLFLQEFLFDHSRGQPSLLSNVCI
jgi:hypothetical protein